jgi:branched-chain amino acid aminotransferase
MHARILMNEALLSHEALPLSPASAGLLNGWAVFSTCLVRDGVIFAWERHVARMRKDAHTLRVPFPEDLDWMKQQLEKLIEANGQPNCTLRVYVMRNKGWMFDSPSVARAWDLIAYTKDLQDWGESARLGVVNNARFAANEFTCTKSATWSWNLTLLERAKEQGFDEVVLLNEHSDVSECTSANLFVVAGSMVLTPPLATSGCLPGVTREILLREIHLPGIDIHEHTLKLEDFEKADEIFITSSTRDVMPVTHIEGLRLKKQNNVWPRLKQAFLDHVNSYVSARAAVRR